MYDRILVPLEKAEAPEACLQHATTLASKLGAELDLLRVITVVPSDDYFFQRIQVEIGSSGARQKAKAEETVNRLAERLRSQGVSANPVVMISDKAEDEAIVEYASKSRSDLIILPNQRRSLVSRWLQGNLTARVQRRSQIPILVVRDEAQESTGED